MTENKITHAELIELGMKWLITRHRCPVVISEIVTSDPEQPDVLGFHDRQSFLIECKISRSDFYADRSKSFRKNPMFGVGQRRWYMAPLGVIKKNEIPPKWGLLEVTDRKKILPVVCAQEQERNTLAEQVILLSLLRRLNIEPDGHIAIKKYEMSGKNKAVFFVKKCFFRRRMKVGP
jgi:hypothetical protein